MARRGIGDARQQKAALMAGRRMIARAERPLYRVRTAQDGSWTVEWCPWLVGTAANRVVALADARTTIAAWLEVEPDAFDVERA